MPVWISSPGGADYRGFTYRKAKYRGFTHRRESTNLRRDNPPDATPAACLWITDPESSISGSVGSGFHPPSLRGITHRTIGVSPTESRGFTHRGPL